MVYIQCLSNVILMVTSLHPRVGVVDPIENYVFWVKYKNELKTQVRFQLIIREHARRSEGVAGSIVGSSIQPIRNMCIATKHQLDTSHLPQLGLRDEQQKFLKPRGKRPFF